MTYENLIPPNTWRRELTEKARAIAKQADIEGRNHYTPEEVAQMEEVMNDLTAALTVEKLIRDVDKQETGES